MVKTCLFQRLSAAELPRKGAPMAAVKIAQLTTRRQVKLKCYACGGIGHSDEQCGLRKAIYGRTGRTKTTAAIVNSCLSQLRAKAPRAAYKDEMPKKPAKKEETLS